MHERGMKQTRHPGGQCREPRNPVCIHLRRWLYDTGLCIRSQRCRREKVVPRCPLYVIVHGSVRYSSVGPSLL